MKTLPLFILFSIFILGCAKEGETKVKTVQNKQFETATFAGGCFWCMEAAFEEIEGVKEVISGYSGGEVENPAYKEVSEGTTGHRETVQIVYDPSKVSYTELLDLFWMQIDPVDAEGQFVDRGPQYKTAIFYHNSTQKKLAENSKMELEKSGKLDKPVVTEILPFKNFYPAEEYHQDYYKKRTQQYKIYKKGSGRDKRLGDLWGGGEIAENKDELRKKLTEIQYKVTQEGSTEEPFNNEYWNNTKEGIYVDIVSGEPLFSSKDKFKSGTGWPSFTKPLEPGNIIKKRDFKLILPRTEVKSKNVDSHLGHVFKDGPEPTGLRYCINSAALRFIPKKELEKEGYGKYRKIFE